MEPINKNNNSISNLNLNATITKRLEMVKILSAISFIAITPILLRITDKKTRIIKKTFYLNADNLLVDGSVFISTNQLDIHIISTLVTSLILLIFWTNLFVSTICNIKLVTKSLEKMNTCRRNYIQKYSVI